MVEEKTIDEVAVEDHRALLGKVIVVRGAQLGDGSDISFKGFRRPIEVRVTGEFDPVSDINESRAGAGAIWDTYWEAEPVNPGDLPAGFHISWIDGPTYHEDGSTESPSSWVTKLWDVL